MCPIKPLRMVTRTAVYNMVISGWMQLTVGKFQSFFRNELGRRKKAITDQNYEISGGRVQKY